MKENCSLPRYLNHILDEIGQLIAIPVTMIKNAKARAK